MCSSRVRRARVPAQEVVDRRPVVLANRRHETSGVRVGRGRRSISRDFVGPLRPFLDPLFDGLDLLDTERPVGRHLRTEGGAGQTVIQTAALSIAGSDIRLRSAAHGVGTAIQPQPAHLLIWAVATDAVLAEDGLHVALKVDPGWELSARRGR